jgi:hypothetical protein
VKSLECLNKQDLIKYLNDKYYALSFWEDLRDVVPAEQKIARLKGEITAAQEELRRLNQKVG